MEASYLNRLPAELRNSIFEDIVVQSQRIRCGVSQEGVHLMDAKQFRNFFPLAETCKQLRQEVLSMVYGSNRFRIVTWGIELGRATVLIENWLTHDLGVEFAGKLRKIELDLEYTPTELLQNIEAIATMFSLPSLKSRIHINAIWTESGYQRSAFPVQIILLGGRLDVEEYIMSVETAVSIQKEVLEQSRLPFWSVNQDMNDLKEARQELLNLPNMLNQSLA